MSTSSWLALLAGALAAALVVLAFRRSGRVGSGRRAERPTGGSRPRSPEAPALRKPDPPAAKEISESSTHRLTAALGRFQSGVRAASAGATAKAVREYESFLAEMRLLPAEAAAGQRALESSARFMLAQALNELERFAEARDHARAGLELGPAKANAALGLAALGEAQLGLDEREEAIGSFEEAARAHPLIGRLHAADSASRVGARLRDPELLKLAARLLEELESRSSLRHVPELRADALVVKARIAAATGEPAQGGAASSSPPRVRPTVAHRTASGVVESTAWLRAAAMERRPEEPGPTVAMVSPTRAASSRASAVVGATRARVGPSSARYARFTAPSPEPSPASLSWSVGEVILGDYRIERELGRGGAGTVVLARSVSTAEPFAVKRISNPARRDELLRELATWVDLPPHPHVLACRFFRGVGDDVLIFAEHAPGGSLRQMLGSDRRPDVGDTLDLATQLAWGIEALHSLNRIHGDVKPANVLLGSDGVAKVSDFGGGRTPAYWSPEQARGEATGLPTDVWSWAVSVLEMFVGDVSWTDGRAAPAVLETLRRGEQAGEAGLPMPESVAGILERCLETDPALRPSAGEAAALLEVAYELVTQRRHGRRRPPLPGHREGLDTAAGPRSSRPRRTGAQWLQEAVELGGSSAPLPADARAGASGRARLVAEIALLERARAILGALVEGGRLELRPKLASLLVDMAAVHAAAEDLPGAAARYESALSLLERLVAHEGGGNQADALALAYQSKARVLAELGELRGALELFDRALAIHGRLVRDEGRQELADELAAACAGKADALAALGDLRAALVLYDEAIGIRVRLVEEAGRDDLAADLALTYRNKATALERLEEPRGAVPIFDEAIAIYRRLVQQQGRPELADELALTYHDKAGALRRLGELRAALGLCDDAITICDRLVRHEGRRQLANELAAMCRSKAVVLARLGDLRAALVLSDQAIAIRERLVLQEGRRELAGDLALTYHDKAITLRSLGELSGALELYDEALAILERLVLREGRAERSSELALAYQNKAIALQNLGELPDAVDLYDTAIRLYERLVLDEGRRELADDLALAYHHKATALESLEDLPGSLALYDAAIVLYERFVLEEERHERADELASTYHDKAIALRTLGDARGAAELSTRAIDILERLVLREGRRELADPLARAYHAKAIALERLGDSRAAEELFDRAVVTLERLARPRDEHGSMRILRIAERHRALIAAERGPGGGQK